MKILCALASALLLSGCLSSSPREATYWNLEFCGEVVPATAPVYGNARLLQVSAVSPLDTRSLLIRRADGSLAFDPYNEFASLPSQLLRNLASAAMIRSKAFKSVVNSTSTVRTDCSVEVVLLRCDLDCTQTDRRLAAVELLVRVVEKGELRSVATAMATADAQAGNYGRAFSEAASKAMLTALSKLR